VEREARLSAGTRGFSGAITPRVIRTARPRPVVAIDGPAGAGKSTVARRVADALSFVLVDTGAMYRAVALAAERARVGWDDGARMGKLARSLLERQALSFDRDPTRGGRIHLDGEDITDAIRTPEIGMGASTASAHPEVRLALLGLQRNAGLQGGVVLEGRDIGTVVFPDAEAKFFLTARPEVRAKRRHDELVAKGTNVTFEETLHDVQKRDEQDTTRQAAPLRQAADALLVDSSELTVDEAVARIVKHVEEVRAQSGLL
jgi:cytidylate kinase